MTDTPKKTLSITRKPATTGPVTSPATPTTVQRTGKRIIRREDLPAVAKAAVGKTGWMKTDRNGKPLPPKAKKPPRKPAPKKQVTPPSDLRMQELDARLNGFRVWVMYQPLSVGIEKEIFKLINDEAFSASKRVVQKVLRMHTNHGLYLQAIQHGGARYTLDGVEQGDVTEYQRQYATETLTKRLQGKS
ncbi:MAG: Fertility inhibition FinO [Thiothrix lacustris]|uniref:Fertility inhibition FinO n=1 Tax=Thiothrix lacustris TaxID=525917 RepID=A0A1Y1QHU0_9GAMM|nr:MAG: Fertility inhibition FinO [Thiothrix lacustris]